MAIIVNIETLVAQAKLGDETAFNEELVTAALRHLFVAIVKDDTIPSESKLKVCDLINKEFLGIF